MPTIQQERGVKTVAGLPLRWGRRAYRELSAALREAGAASDRYQALAGLLDEVTAAPFPLDATDAHLCVLATHYANECSSAGVPLEAEVWNWKEKRHERVAKAAITEPGALRTRMATICRMHGIQPPTVADDAQAIARCTDPAWWRRALRKTHGRTMEAAAIRLGFVSVRAGAYASDETVARRLAQVARNRAALESVTIKNEDGYECTLAEAASKTTSNKRIRRGELMLRLAGCEDVANEAGHVGVFFTLTAPSKYHAVIQQSGNVNRNYNDSTPRQVQAYLQKTWAKIRTAYGRHNIKPYGFRIAEPHHDGCVHWHGLVFMPAYKVRRFCQIVRRYALMEDGDEPGARKHRATFERIDSAKGSAAAYIAKYISKNINDDSEDAHDEVIGPNGEPVKITMPNDAVKKASQRVDAWAGVWGIRQFQPIGQPPVTVWRELRRVSEEAIQGAPANVRAAWDACQRVMRTDPDTGEVLVERPADFGAYVRAQGGVGVGRDYRIAIAKEASRVEGRYGVYEGMASVGIYARIAPDAVYQSTRYTWTVVRNTSGRAEAHRGGDARSGGVAFDSPWSPVNNCTAPHWAAGAMPGEVVAEFDDVWFESEEYQKIFVPPERAGGEWHAAEVAAHETRAATVWTVPSYSHRKAQNRGHVGTKTKGQ